MSLRDPLEASAGPGAAIGGRAYEAHLGGGERIGLVLEAPGGEPPVGCAAEAAGQMARVEPLLALLEAWLAPAAEAPQELDWQWPANLAEAPSAGAKARWAGPGIAAELTLPWPLLRRLAPPPEPLARQLQWRPVAATLVLATVTLSPQERAALEPGGALLLPASFEPDWIARLRAVEEPGPGGLAVRLSLSLSSSSSAVRQCLAADDLPAAGASGGDPPGREGWELRNPLPAPLAPELLLGWRDEPVQVDFGRPVGLWCPIPGATASGRAPEALRAEGRLVPWGEGHAMCIESVGGDSAA